MKKQKKNKTAHCHIYWDQNELNDEKTGFKKSRETVPLTLLFFKVPYFDFIHLNVLNVSENSKVFCVFKISFSTYVHCNNVLYIHKIQIS